MNFIFFFLTFNITNQIFDVLLFTVLCVTIVCMEIIGVFSLKKKFLYSNLIHGQFEQGVLILCSIT